MAEMTETEHLAAIEAIKRLKARLVRALDTKDWATYEALHAPDHVSDSEGETPRQGSRANTEFVIRSLQDKVTCHHVHSPEITILSDTSATGVWAMQDQIWWKIGDQQHWFRGCGFYHEAYEKRGGAWVFTHRRLTRLHVEFSAGATIGQYQAEPGPSDA